MQTGATAVSVATILNKGYQMDIATFRAHKTKMLSKQEPAIRDTINHRVNYVLDLLGTETMSVEGLALIISQVAFETKSLDQSKYTSKD